MTCTYEAAAAQTLTNCIADDIGLIGPVQKDLQGGKRQQPAGQKYIHAAFTRLGMLKVVFDTGDTTGSE